MITITATSTYAYTATDAIDYIVTVTSNPIYDLVLLFSVLGIFIFGIYTSLWFIKKVRA